MSKQALEKQRLALLSKIEKFGKRKSFGHAAVLKAQALMAQLTEIETKLAQEGK